MRIKHTTIEEDTEIAEEALKELLKPEQHRKNWSCFNPVYVVTAVFLSSIEFENYSTALSSLIWNNDTEITYLFVISFVLGCLIAMLMTTFIYKKYAIWLGASFYMINIIIAVVTDKIYLVQRVLAGLGVGLMLPGCLVNCIEISFTKLRGDIFTFLLFIYYFASVISQTITFVAGSQQPTVLLYISLVLACLTFYILFAPTDPYSYITHVSLKMIKETEAFYENTILDGSKPIQESDTLQETIIQNNTIPKNTIQNHKPLLSYTMKPSKNNSSSLEDTLTTNLLSQETQINIPDYYEYNDEDEIPQDVLRWRIVDFFGEDNSDERCDLIYNKYIYEKEIGQWKLFKITWKNLLFSFFSMFAPICLSKTTVIYRTMSVFSSLNYDYDTNIYFLGCNIIICFSSFIFMFINDILNRKLSLQIAYTLMCGILIFFSVASYFSDLFENDISSYIQIGCSCLYFILYGGLIFPLSVCYSQEYLPMTIRYNFTNIIFIFFIIFYMFQEYFKDLIASISSTCVIYSLSALYCFIYITCAFFIDNTSKVELESIIEYTE